MTEDEGREEEKDATYSQKRKSTLDTTDTSISPMPKCFCEREDGSSPSNGIDYLNWDLESTPELRETMSQLSCWDRFRAQLVHRSICLVFLATVVYIIVDLIFFGNVEALFKAALVFIEENGFLGMICFIALFIIATVVLFPPVILTYGAGFAFAMCYGVVWGTVVGTLCVLVGALIGSVVAFWLGRYVIREAVSKWVQKYKILSAIDVAVKDHGFKVSALLRTSPLIPFGILNYLFAVTRITFKDFALGTVGIIPGTIAFVLFGALSSSAVTMSKDDGDESNQTIKLVLLIVGIIATIAAVIFVGIKTKRILKETLDEAQRETQLNTSNIPSTCEFCTPTILEERA